MRFSRKISGEESFPRLPADNLTLKYDGINFKLQPKKKKKKKKKIKKEKRKKRKKEGRDEKKIPHLFSQKNDIFYGSFRNNSQ